MITAACLLPISTARYFHFVAVNLVKEIEDSLCVSHIGKSREERVVLFVKMVNGYRYRMHLTFGFQQSDAL